MATTLLDYSEKTVRETAPENKDDFKLGSFDFAKLKNIRAGLKFEHAVGWRAATTGQSRPARKMEGGDGERHYEHEVEFTDGPLKNTRSYRNLNYYYPLFSTKIIGEQ